MGVLVEGYALILVVVIFVNAMPFHDMQSIKDEAGKQATAGDGQTRLLLQKLLASVDNTKYPGLHIQTHLDSYRRKYLNEDLRAPVYTREQSNDGVKLERHGRAVEHAHGPGLSGDDDIENTPLSTGHAPTTSTTEQEPGHSPMHSAEVVPHETATNSVGSHHVPGLSGEHPSANSSENLPDGPINSDGKTELHSRQLHPPPGSHEHLLGEQGPEPVPGHSGELHPPDHPIEPTAHSKELPPPDHPEPPPEPAHSAEDKMLELLAHILEQVRAGHVTITEVHQWMLTISEAMKNGTLSHHEYDKFMHELMAIRHSAEAHGTAMDDNMLWFG